MGLYMDAIYLQALRSCESAVLSALSEKEMDHSLLFDFPNIETPSFAPEILLMDAVFFR